MASSYNKRTAKKAKINTCPNPVFEKWVQEMRDDAITRDLQSKHTFTKCLNSLRKYPLPLNSGKECIILEGFGDKICTVIDNKLDLFLADGGKLHENVDESSNENGQKLMTKISEPEKEKSILKAKKKPVSQKDDFVNEKLPNEPTKTSLKSNTREYKPEFRSGGYALLIALLNNTPENSSNSEQRSMLKADLIKSAQKHCDASFSCSDGTSHYTAWSSMSSLTKKELVIKSNTNPANYKLTEQGRNLALKLLKNNQSAAEEYSDCIQEKQNTTKKRQISEKAKRSEKNSESSSDSDVETEYERHTSKEIAPTKELKSIENLKEKHFLQTKKAFETDEIILDSSGSDSNSNDGMMCLSNESLTRNAAEKVQESVQPKHAPGHLLQDDILLSLKSGKYEIILLDTCETSHAKRQEIFLKELEKTDVKFEISKLNIGDFTWIARPKSSASASFQNMDLVLDYIVERKRVDDLCQSIIDGRYKEQKFRLKRCGISNIIYLIESFGSMKNFSLPESSIKQAIVNTQIIDEFYVKETQNIKDSVNYLVQLTDHIIDLYSGFTLNGCLKDKIDEHYGKFSTKIEREKPHINLMTFQEFNQNSNKNKAPTVKEMFGRCLIQINGLSQDKCISILDKYPTPAHLFEVLESCQNENSRHKLLANLKCGKQNRNLGPALSKLLSMVFYK